MSVMHSGRMRMENGDTAQNFPVLGIVSGGRPVSGTSHLSLQNGSPLREQPLPWSNHTTSKAFDEPIHVLKTSDLSVNTLLTLP